MDTEADYLFLSKTCFDTEPIRAWCFSVVCRTCYDLEYKKCNKSKYLKDAYSFGDRRISICSFFVFDSVVRGSRTFCPCG